jgi:hypothetical protein
VPIGLNVVAAKALVEYAGRKVLILFRLVHAGAA